MSSVAEQSSSLADGDISFADLGVIAPIVAALRDAGITHPFPIQKLALPIALEGTDLIGQARTGTGKTLAFGIAALQRLTPSDPVQGRLPQTLILCPTRELALQVTDDISTAAAHLDVSILTVYGGVGYDTQLDTLTKGVDVVVGTPGRLLDLVQRRNLQLTRVQTLVLDEADEMLDLGFLPDVERLISKIPSRRQTLLFSATMPAAIVSLARVYLNHPVNIRAETTDASTMVPNTRQFVYQTHELDKPAIIAKLLHSPDAERVMVFCKTKRHVQRVADELAERGFSVASLHGDLSQQVRERALNRFKAGRVQVIVATDVAARGIDVVGVTHVVNFDCPDDEKVYVHRIGRTGRAGHPGVAITLLDWSDIPRWKVINRLLNLDFADPIEAYSTSPQLLEDLNIPADVVLKAPAAPPRSDSDQSGERRHRSRGNRDERGARRDHGDRSDGKDRFDRGPRRDQGDRRSEGSDRRSEGRDRRRDHGDRRGDRRRREGYASQDGSVSRDDRDSRQDRSEAQPTTEPRQRSARKRVRRHHGVVIETPEVPTSSAALDTPAASSESVVSDVKPSASLPSIQPAAATNPDASPDEAAGPRRRRRRRSVGENTEPAADVSSSPAPSQDAVSQEVSSRLSALGM
jgi:superfamily II DNA/RNA helicase